MPTIQRGVATSHPLEAKMAPTKDRDIFSDKQTTPAAKASAKPAEDKVDYNADPHALGASTAEEAATAEAMSDRIEDGVLHIPTSVEEHAEIANKEQAQINEAMGFGDVAEGATPLTGGPPAHRILAYDGPLNLKDRVSGWNADHLDTVSDDPTLKGPGQ